MRRKKSKKQKRIIIILVLILILLIILLVALAKKSQKEQSVETPTFEEFIQEYENKVIYPRNMSEMMSFEGDTPTQTIYESFRVFVDYISYLNENVNTSNSKEFFKENSKEIQINLGITDEESFTTLITYLNQNDVNASDFNYAEIEINSSYVEKRYFKFILNLYYGEENRTVQFKVSFAEKKNNKIPVIYEVVQ